MTLYSEWLMGVLEEDLQLSDEELAQLEDILEGAEEVKAYCGMK